MHKSMLALAALGLVVGLSASSAQAMPAPGPAAGKIVAEAGQAHIEKAFFFRWFFGRRHHRR